MQQMEEGNSEDRAVAAKYVKAIEKDQIAKLLCFCTRPAIYSPAYNWLCEFMSTIVLVRSSAETSLLCLKAAVFCTYGKCLG